MKSRKLFSLALALVLALSIFSVQGAFAVSVTNNTVVTEALEGGRSCTYTLSANVIGTEEYTYFTEEYEDGQEETVKTPHTVTVYQLPVQTLITSEFITKDEEAHMNVDKNAPGAYLWIEFIPEMGYMFNEYDSFTIPDTSNYYYITTNTDFFGIEDTGFWVKGVTVAPTTPADTGNPNAKQAIPSPCMVYVNFAPVNFDAYVIDGNNYMKLRDVAYAFRNTNKKFNVDWDGTQNAINMISNTDYKAVGNEMIAGDGQAKAAIPCTATILLDGTPVELVGYTIGQNNYFKLRSICEVFDIYVEWVPSDGSVLVDTHINELMEIY